jgi:predicted component of type VI protein secretion system
MMEIVTMPELSVMRGGRALSKWTLDDKELTIGRGPDCHIVLEDSLISWHHAKIVKAYGGYLFEDLGSTNGSTINGLHITKQMLRYGDVVNVGTHDLCYNHSMDDKYSVPTERTVVVSGASESSSSYSHQDKAANVSIRFMNGPDSGKSESISSSFHKIGKGATLAAIVCKNGVYFLEKLSGENPTINGSPIADTGTRLKDYDKLKVGNDEMRFIVE